MASVQDALRATVAELERLRYEYGARNDGECPSCHRRVHTAACRLVAALDLAREARATAEEG